MVENLQYLALLLSPFQLVVHDGRIITCHYTPKIIFTIASDKIMDIANSFM